MRFPGSFPLAWSSALGALVLLLLVVVGIGFNLARGRHPDCHCFGQLHKGTAGWPTLIRNLVLAAGAFVVVAFGRSIPGPDVTPIKDSTNGFYLSSKRKVL